MNGAGKNERKSIKTAGGRSIPTTEKRADQIKVTTRKKQGMGGFGASNRKGLPFGNSHGGKGDFSVKQNLRGKKKETQNAGNCPLLQKKKI